jgi:Arc-like DNA binding domain
MVKKRAPGGGRKPQGEFDQLTSPFSLRMPEYLREQLDAAAKESGKVASQELLTRLNQSFVRDRKRAGDPATQAICFLISELPDKIRWVLHDRMNDWVDDPFLFSAFKIAVAKLLDEIGPKGDVSRPVAIGKLMKALDKVEPKVSDVMKADWKSPSRLGKKTAAQVLNDLREGGWHPGDVKEMWSEVFPDDKNFIEGATAAAERTWYGMDQARRDLRLEPKYLRRPIFKK